MSMQSMSAWLAAKAAESKASSELAVETASKVFEAVYPKAVEAARAEQAQLIAKYLAM